MAALRRYIVNVIDMRIPCPACSTPNAFPLRRRPKWGRVIEVYISCTMCPYATVLRESTKEIEELLKIKDRIRVAYDNQVSRYGQPTQITWRQLRDINNKIEEEKRSAGIGTQRPPTSDSDASS